MEQKFIFNVEVYPIIHKRILCVEQCVPDFGHGKTESFVVSARDFAQASAAVTRHFSRWINKYRVVSMATVQEGK